MSNGINYDLVFLQSRLIGYHPVFQNRVTGLLLKVLGKDTKIIKDDIIVIKSEEVLIKESKKGRPFNIKIVHRNRDFCMKLSDLLRKDFDHHFLTKHYSD